MTASRDSLELRRADRSRRSLLSNSICRTSKGPALSSHRTTRLLDYTASDNDTDDDLLAWESASAKAFLVGSGEVRRADHNLWNCRRLSRCAATFETRFGGGTASQQKEKREPSHRRGPEKRLLLAEHCTRDPTIHSGVQWRLSDSISHSSLEENESGLSYLDLGAELATLGRRRNDTATAFATRREYPATRQEPPYRPALGIAFAFCLAMSFLLFSSFAV